MEQMYRREMIEIIRFLPKNFPVMARFSSIKIKKILKECTFERYKKGETAKFLNGMIMMAGLIRKAIKSLKELLRGS